MLGQVFEFVQEQIQEHWVKFLLGLFVMGVGWLLGRRRAMIAFRNRDFLDRLNVSLTTLQPGEPLRIRTILEKRCDAILLNKSATETLIEAARKTTEQDPILPLSDEDYWYFLNPVLNEVAEKFAESALKRDLGQPVVMKRYLLCLTCEAASTVRQKKIRAMLVQKESLLNLPEEAPTFEANHHDTRWKTLKVMAATFARRPKAFVEIELGV